MSNVQSYNALIDRFKAFASGHFILKSFSHGQIDTADLEKFTEYPFMHVVPSNVTYAKGTKTFSFQIVLADLPRDKDDKVEFQREVLSDLQRIAEDLVAEITNHRVLFGDLITVQNVSLEPFLEEFHNTLTGWTVSLDLLVPYYWDACSIPAEWNDMFESSTGGTGSILTFVDSITRDEYGNVSLVNDEANPAPNYYYGTNDEGVRGWYLLTDEVGLTCATIGTCQTIIDIESAIDDLQTEILLKANTADLGAVAFSNDYNDLDNLPNLSGYGDMFKSVYDTDVDGVVDSAERIQIVVRNSTGSTLTKGQIVYLSGATGNRPNAVLAQANTEATSSKTIGMVIADIANNADGQVAVNGTLHDLDTSAFTAGDTLWLSATTAGGMVANTPPAEPNHAVFIGYVARSHPNLGRVVLAIQNGYELDELHGVQITTPANNEVLTYESSTSLWKNKTVETALGYTPVPTTRSITINGTTQDLSADRTFTIATGLTVGTTPITSGTVGRVLFEGTGNVLQESANLFWDNTNNRLGIRNLAGSIAAVFGGQSATPFWVGIGTVDGGTAPLIQAYNNTLSGTTKLCLNAVGGNVLIGTTTDAGYKLDVNGTARIQNQLTTTGSISAASAVARGTFFNQTLVATANNDVLVGLDIQPTFTLGAFTGVQSIALRVNGNILPSANGSFDLGISATRFRNGWFAGSLIAGSGYFSDLLFGTTNLRIYNSTSTQIAQMFGATGNLTLQNGGTFTDAGFRLDVNGSVRTTGSISAASAVARGTYLNQTLVATANNDVLVGLDIQPTFTLGAFAGVARFALRIRNSANDGSVFAVTSDGIVRWGNRIESGNNTGQLSWDTDLVFINAAVNLGFRTGGVDRMRILSTGNVVIQNGGTFTDVASSRLTINSTTQGFLPPRMTNAQMLAIASPAAGLVVYDTTNNKHYGYNGTTWNAFF